MCRCTNFSSLHSAVVRAVRVADTGVESVRGTNQIIVLCRVGIDRSAGIVKQIGCCNIVRCIGCVIDSVGNGRGFAGVVGICAEIV